METLYYILNKLMSLPIQADQLGQEIGNGIKDITTQNPTTQNPTATGTSVISEFIANVIKVAIPIGVFSTIVLLAYGGYQMIMSQGNPEKLNEAKEIITNALIGFAVVVLAISILWFISSFFSLNQYGVPNT